MENIQDRSLLLKNHLRINFGQSKIASLIKLINMRPLKGSLCFFQYIGHHPGIISALLIHNSFNGGNFYSI